MNNNGLIIIITGETGSGKSFIVRKILPQYPNIKTITKYMTRKSRVDEVNRKDVLGNIPIEEILTMEYSYKNPLNQEHYGFKKSDIDRILEEGKIPCVELSNEETYQKLRQDYPGKVLLLKVVPYFDEETMKATFEKQGRDPKEFEERKEALNHPLTDWAYSYDNMRQIVNPYFLRNCSENVSYSIVVERLERVIQGECHADLGCSLMGDDETSRELYQYLYGYSKNRPVDQEMSFSKESQK